MSPCLCFPEQFEPIVNSHLVKLTSSQLLATSLILCSSIYSLVINFSNGGGGGGGGGVGGACVDGLGDYANIKVYKLLPSFPSICSKKKSNKVGFHVKYHTYFPICCKVTIRRFSTTQTSSTLTPQLSKPMKGTLEQRSPTGARLYIQFNYNSTSRDTKLK